MIVHPTLSVLYSELVLSLYPILIKSVNTNIFTQILVRFIVFPVLALVFGSTYDFKSIWGNPYEAFIGILQGLLNLGHVAVSYISFKTLSVGSAISLFYLYPIFNLIAGSLLFGEKLSYISLLLIIVAFTGTYLIATSHKYQGNPDKTKSHNLGIIMGILSAISETMIFIFIRSNTDAQRSPFYAVNHLYPFGLLVLLIASIYNKNLIDTKSINWVKLIGFNALLGFTGYISRFYAISRVPTIVFSLLSFIGVSFGYIWGILFTDDEPKLKGIIGGVLIALSIGILRYFNIS
jgi:drug/metabolite transporter (DMT)-like permease